jgi:hypothetical protein
MKFLVFLGVISFNFNTYANPCDKFNNPAHGQKYAECLIQQNDRALQAPCSIYNSAETVNDLIGCLRKNPPEDIRKKYIEVRDYLEHHKVYVSMSTSPERLPYIPTVLKTIDLHLVSEILVILPKQFKNKKNYPDPLPNEVVHFPKVTILRPEVDIGPITKIIPALEYVKAMDPKSIVISIDDDQAYPIGIFSDLVRFLIKNDKKVVGGIGQAQDFWHLRPQKISFHNKCRPGGYCDIVEGFSAIAYVAGAVPTKKMKIYSQASDKCRLGDDIVINYTLQEFKIPRYRIQTKFFKKIVNLYYGFGSDALHNQNNYNASYQECIESIENLNEKHNH